MLLYLYSIPWHLRRFTFYELGSLTVSSRRRWRWFELLLCRLRLQHQNIGDVWRHAFGDGARCLFAAQ